MAWVYRHSNLRCLLCLVTTLSLVPEPWNHTLQFWHSVHVWFFQFFINYNASKNYVYLFYLVLDQPMILLVELFQSHWRCRNSMSTPPTFCTHWFLELIIYWNLPISRTIDTNGSYLSFHGGILTNFMMFVLLIACMVKLIPRTYILVVGVVFELLIFDLLLLNLYYILEYIVTSHWSNYLTLSIENHPLFIWANKIWLKYKLKLLHRYGTWLINYNIDLVILIH